jgi:hypothetical protein
MPAESRFLSSIVFAVAGMLSACRNATDTAPGALTVVPSTQGANGCSGPDQTFTPPQTPGAVTLATLVIGPQSQVTAAGTGEMLYATGLGGQIVALDVSVTPPAETELVPAGNGAGTVADLLVTAGIATAPSISGIAVLDANHLVVVEQTSNTLLSVQRSPPFAVSFYAGQPNETPGFANGLAQGGTLLARFSLGIATQVCPTGDVPPKVFVADAGNHAVRLVQADSSGVLQVVTIAGSGLPFFSDGALLSTFFDTPTGLSTACNGLIIVSERGGNGFGQRIRKLEIGQAFPFGGFVGTSSTLAGDGVAATVGGVGTAAEVSAPVSPLVTSAGEIYWIDSGSGVLRRMKLDGTVDCPLDVDCTSAAATPTFPPGDEFSLTQTPAGVLFVMDATAGLLYRVTP